jgi:hypothetical protein
MPMMVLDDKSFDEELYKYKQVSNAVFTSDDFNPAKVVDIQRGRGNKLEVPQALREVIATEAITNGNSATIAKSFDVSKSSVDAYKNGATSTASYNKPNNELKVVTDNVRETISDAARARLMDALDQITPEALAGVKVKDAASIAKDMSGIIKNLEPNTPQQVNNTQVVVFKPRMQDEEEFEVITINE